MEETKNPETTSQEVKETPKPKAEPKKKTTKKPQNSNNNPNNKKTRTHVPVKGFTIDQLRQKNTLELIEAGKELNIENPQELQRQDLIFAILETQTTQGGYVLFTGILDIKDAGFGFLRPIDGKFSDTYSDSYVSATQIKRFALRSGDIVSGQVRPPAKERDRKSVV